MRNSRMLAEDEPSRLLTKYKQTVCFIYLYKIIFFVNKTYFFFYIEFRKCFSSSMFKRSRW